MVVLCMLVLSVGLMCGVVIGLYWASQTNLSEVISVRQKNEDLLPDYQQALNVANDVVASLSAELAYTKANLPVVVATPTPTEVLDVTYINPNAHFTGEDLWQAVNTYRSEHGVGELQLHPDLCQMSSHRLGELLELKKLDNHAGFEKYFEKKSVADMGLSNVAENLASGYASAEEIVDGWDSSPPHRTFLLADNSYIYGCTSANLGFGVLIGGY